ncbi:hypothetical protein MMC21_005749 [Puttea exsequens]|nr:hypothetical protein [Puttea exsequens]
MDAENISFEALEQRLQHLLRASNGSAVSIEPEDPQIDPSQPQYLCAECTYTTYRLDYFQEHFWRKHVLRRKCLWHGCDNLSSTKEEHEAHVLERHGARCPKDGCNQVFKYKYQTREHLAASHQPVLVLNHVECPWTGCEEKFVDQATLKAHWDCIHTPYTYQAEKDKPFKCPFCHKRYVIARFVQAHANTHSNNRWAPKDGIDEFVNQQTLLRGARSPSTSNAQSQTPHVKLETTSDDESEAPDNDKEYTITIQNGRIYIDNELIIGSPSPTPTPHHDYQLQPSTAPNEKMAIGYILQPHSTDTPMPAPSPPQSPNPEALALSPLSPPTPSPYGPLLPLLPIPPQFRSLILSTLHLLSFGSWIAVSEVFALFSALLESPAQSHILHQLADIRSTARSADLIDLLQKSTLADMITAYATFKLAAFRNRPRGVPVATTFHNTLLALLSQCIALETVIDEAISRGIPTPTAVRRPPRDRNIISDRAVDTDTLIQALEGRARCRAAHPRWVVWSRSLLLGEGEGYLADLRGVVEGMGRRLG